MAVGSDVEVTLTFKDGSALPFTAQVRTFPGAGENYQPAEHPPATMDDQSGLKPGGEAGVSRRRLLVGGAAAAGVVGASAWAVAESRKGPLNRPPSVQAVPFYGTHQAGIATSPQSNATPVGLDLVPDGKREAREVLRAVLKLWTTTLHVVDLASTAAFADHRARTADMFDLA